MAGLYKSQGWRAVEDRVLALVQLWADTFMMHEDTYPAFMKLYRELRKEGIKFPTRDPNERFMIKFDGDPSPAFELADMEQQVKGGSERDQPIRAESRIREEEEKEPRLTQADIDMLTRNLPLLEDMIIRARDVRDLQEPNVKEVVRHCRTAQKKLIWVISYKASNSKDERETNELLGVMDYINSKMESFKSAVAILKKGGSAQEIRAVLKNQSEGDENLLELGEDFLEIQEKNPLEKLEKYIYGREPEQKFEEIKNTIIQEPKVNEPQPLRRLAPPPDLLIDEPEESTPPPHIQQIPHQDIFDLNAIFSQPPPQQMYQTPGFYNQPQFPSYNPYQNQPGFQQYPQGFPNQPYPQQYVQPVPVQPRDEFEDFFSEIANRR